MSNGILLLMTLVATGVPLLLALAFWLTRRMRRPAHAPAFSPVTRQHIELIQGAPFNQSAVEAAKRRFRDLLERGEPAAVEASLRAGMQFVFQVRALAEIGTEEAGLILERQLQRRLTADALEQSWYWIDLAEGLRHLERHECLPSLLRCAAAAGDLPLAHFLAAETTCFLGFASYLEDPHTVLGRCANQVLYRAIDGLRFGVPPDLLIEARLGEVLESLWDQRGDCFHPLQVRIAHAAWRLIQRGNLLTEDLDTSPQGEDGRWQMGRLEALQPVLENYLDQAPVHLQRQLAQAQGESAEDVLLAINDLRVDLGPDLIGWAAQPANPHRALAIEALTWSRDGRVGPWLRDFAQREVPMASRAQRRPRAQSPSRPSLPPDVPYLPLLHALRGQPSADTERLLVLASRDWDPLVRAAAFASLGWWEPCLPGEVKSRLGAGKIDPNPEVRRAARAALARLGERQALSWFRQALAATTDQALAEGIQNVANEGLILLWPDLDRLLDSERQEIKPMVREALARLSEEMEWDRKKRR